MFELKRWWADVWSNDGNGLRNDLRNDLKEWRWAMRCGFEAMNLSDEMWVWSNEFKQWDVGLKQWV